MSSNDTDEKKLILGGPVPLGNEEVVANDDDSEETTIPIMFSCECFEQFTTVNAIIMVSSLSSIVLSSLAIAGKLDLMNSNSTSTNSSSYYRDGEAMPPLM